MKQPYQWMQATKTRRHTESATIPFWKQPPQISSEWLLNDKHQMTSSPWKAPRLFQWLPMYEWKDMYLHHTSSSRQAWNEEPEPLNRKASIFERAGLQTIQWHPILRQFECPSTIQGIKRIHCAINLQITSSGERTNTITDGALPGAMSFHFCWLKAKSIWNHIFITSNKMNYNIVFIC